MIRYIPNNEIDKKKWDRCVHYAANGIVYAYSWYLDVVAGGWDALIQDDYTSVMPLIWNKKLGIYYIYQPFFTQQLGVFSNHLSEELIQSFLEAIPEKFKYIHMQLNSRNRFNLSQQNIYKRITYHLDLIESHEKITEAFSENTKRNIKKAVKNNIQIVKSGKPEEFIQLLKENQGKKTKSITKKHYKLGTALIYHAIHKNMGELWMAYDANNQICGGIFWVISHHKAISLILASNTTARNTGVMHYLIDAFIKSKSGTNLTIDFEGSMIPSIARFYASFGAQPIEYILYKLNKLPWYIKFLKK